MMLQSYVFLLELMLLNHEKKRKQNNDKNTRIGKREKE